ncbi:PqqD family protein [Anaeromicropila populeti]|uniref:Coenzyme PQQ synthesis protein D (PqqD) n=1 Tax=Anaeromicropila populeti TaxID=37658 RepID=A0A1I6HW44_9FIRM|nr:PqqD family protein [Anaeromicropila populeti]SFR58430.1 Coenzyme PQQ synthesis protein D (PqqD) [Anaeromicropila populeti]
MQIKEIRIKEGFLLRELGGEFCLVFEGDTNNGALEELPSINETGIFLWHKLEQGATAEELVEALQRKNQIDYEDAELDVGEFLAKLINGKVVTFER